MISSLRTQCDVVVAGSADASINFADVEGFLSIMALSEEKKTLHMRAGRLTLRAAGL